MDSDDCWDKQLLNDVYNTFSKFQCDIVSFKWRYMESDGNLSASIPSIYPKANTLYSIDTLITKFLTEEVENSLCKRAVRKSRVNPKHLLELSKKKELRLGEDMIQSFVMMKDCETMVYLDKALYFYRANMQSLTHQSSIQKTIIDTAIAREYLQELLLTSNFHQTKYQLMIERNFLEHYLTDLVTLSNNSNINALKNITSNIRELSIYKDAIRQIRREKLGRKRRLLYDLEQRNMWLFFWIISKIYKKLIA